MAMAMAMAPSLLTHEEQPHGVEATALHSVLQNQLK